MNKTYGTRKYYPSTINKAKKNNQPDLKKEQFLIRTYVSLIMVVLTLIIAKVNSPQTQAITSRLRQELSKNISIEEVYTASREKIESLPVFKELENFDFEVE